jgi:D-alanyl-D-alanine dipeptidase
MLKEWWHFSLPGTAGGAYDFPVARRGKQEIAAVCA